MKNEIKEILEYIRKWMGLSEIPMIVKLEDYITNLQEETHKQIHTSIVQKKQIKNLQQENERLKQELVKIPRAKMEYDLELEDYKSRCEKADNQLKIIMQIIKEQPTRNIEDDEWIENRLIAVANILQNGDNNEVNK